MKAPAAWSQLRLALAWTLAVILPAPGVYLLSGYGDDDRSLSWLQQHLRVIEVQLAGLEGLLDDYARIHDRYPTNDEGLGGATCYIMSPVFAYRDRDMDHRQRQLLDRLLAEGAISPETHRKAVATLADEK